MTSRVIDFIYDHIQKNQLSTGEDLPSELKASKELNVSRGVVREAFCLLQVAGIIEKENGRSPKVGFLNGSFLTHLLVHALLTRQVDNKQVLELRACIEVKAAQLAALRRTRSDVQKLRTAVEGMKSSIGKIDTFLEYDLDFHQVINGATGNPLIEMVCSAMHESIKESIRAGLRLHRGPARIGKVAEDHSLIADAIEVGNALQAEACMRRHFEEAVRLFGRLEE